jgi:hypothetical protein
MYRLGQQRRATGRPSWEHQLKLADVFHNDDLTFEQKRDEIVRRIRASAWFRGCHKDDDLVCTVEELADTEDVPAFDYVWDAIYDLADADRVWIETR